MTRRARAMIVPDPGCRQRQQAGDEGGLMVAIGKQANRAAGVGIRIEIGRTIGGAYHLQNRKPGAEQANQQHDRHQSFQLGRLKLSRQHDHGQRGEQAPESVDR